MDVNKVEEIVLEVLPKLTLPGLGEYKLNKKFLIVDVTRDQNDVYTLSLTFEYPCFSK